jgi:threonine/homoserine/homoserine lactone efflux protein
MESSLKENNSGARLMAWAEKNPELATVISVTGIFGLTFLGYHAIKSPKPASIGWGMIKAQC